MEGILIIAAGHPYYGVYAHQLAMSIKAQSSVNITLAYTDSAITHLRPDALGLFDKKVKIPEKMYMKGAKQDFFRIKTHMYQLSPYKETIYLDADTILVPNSGIDSLFEQFKEIDFTICNRGVFDLDTDQPFARHRWYWADLNEVKEVHGKGNLWQIHSEFVYFKKCDKISKLFKDAQKLFDKPGVELTIPFAGGVPDELPLAISMLKNGIDPHQVNYIPFYWEPKEHKNMSIGDVMKLSYIGYSIGGSQRNRLMEKCYFALVNHFSKNHHHTPKPLKPKRDWIPSRANI